MNRKPYFEALDKKKHVYQVFQTIAGGYDAANGRISAGQHMRWKRHAARTACKTLPENGRALDVGCGTGDMAGLMRKERPNAQIVGVDLSPDMLEVAEEKYKKDPRMSFFQADASELPFEDAEFDTAVISFALRNTSDYKKVLSEMIRVVKPGGRICCIDSFVPKSRLIRPFYEMYFSLIMPLVGGGVRYWRQYRWLEKSTRYFISPDELGTLLTKLGLNDIEGKKFMFGACVCECGRKGGGEGSE